MSKLEVGCKAPEFTLFDNHNKKHTLSDYQDKWLLLFFYPKDNTPGCTVEACQFRDYFADISALETKILGISTDKLESHNHFINKHQLPFPLLIDNKGTMSKLYGSLFKFGPIKLSKRHSFIIDPQGKISKIYRKVSPSDHVQQIMADLKTLQTNYNLIG